MCVHMELSDRKYVIWPSFPQIHCLMFLASSLPRPTMTWKDCMKEVAVRVLMFVVYLPFVCDKHRVLYRETKT